MCISYFCQRTCWQRANRLSDMAAGMIPGTTCLYLVWHHRFKILCAHRADACHPCTGLFVFISECFPSFKKIKPTLAKHSVAQAPAARHQWELVRGAQSQAPRQSFKCRSSTGFPRGSCGHQTLRSTDVYRCWLEITSSCFGIFGNGSLRIPIWNMGLTIGTLQSFNEDWKIK